jgi:hypothetical protein
LFIFPPPNPPGNPPFAIKNPPFYLFYLFYLL